MALGPISEHKRLCVKYRLLNRKNRVVTGVCTILEKIFNEFAKKTGSRLTKLFI